MVVDHLRFVSSQFSWTFLPGRLVFPLFCLVIAFHLQFFLAGSGNTLKIRRYLFWLVCFAILSEWPYEMLMPKSRSYNIFITLALGVIFVYPVHSRFLSNIFKVTVILITLFLQEKLMYGLYGVLLPLAFMLALRSNGGLWLLPVMLCFFANYRYVTADIFIELNIFQISALLIASMTPLVGKWICEQTTPLNIWPVKKWGYFFYPGQLLILYGLKVILQ